MRGVKNYEALTCNLITIKALKCLLNKPVYAKFYNKRKGLAITEVNNQRELLTRNSLGSGKYLCITALTLP